MPLIADPQAWASRLVQLGWVRQAPADRLTGEQAAVHRGEIESDDLREPDAGQSKRTAIARTLPATVHPS